MTLVAQKNLPEKIVRWGFYDGTSLNENMRLVEINDIFAIEHVISTSKYTSTCLLCYHSNYQHVSFRDAIEDVRGHYNERHRMFTSPDALILPPMSWSVDK